MDSTTLEHEMKPTHCFKLVLASLFSLGLTAAEAAPSNVHIYNWYDYIAPDATKNFERETGIGTIYDVFDTSEVMQSKLMAGGSGYDVVVATGDLLPNLIKAGVLKELDRAHLPNWKHLDPNLLIKLQANDPGNRYAVPYLWGTTGIGYDRDKVEAILGPNAPVDSWDLVFTEENLAKLSQCGVAMIDAPGEIIPIALNYLGLPHNSQNPRHYRKAEELLMKVRPYIRYFNSAKFVSDLTNGEICVVIGWAGGVYEAQQTSERNGNGRKLLYSIPREGAPIWVENMVLLNDAPHPEAGLSFINYMLRPEVIAATSNFLGYPNANKDATQLIEQKVRDNPMVYPPKDAIAILFPLQHLPLKLERVRTRVWSKVKTGQ